MPLYTGQHGIVRHNPNYDGTGSSLTSALQVRNWQVNLVSPTIDTTTLGQTWVTRIAIDSIVYWHLRDQLLQDAY